MKEIFRLEIIENGYNVFFGNPITVCQIYNVDEVQTFTWAEVQANLDKLNKPLPVVILPLDEQARIAYLDRIEQILIERRGRGFEYDGSRWQADSMAQVNMASIMGLVQIGAFGPFLWRDIDNVNHMLSNGGLNALAIQMAGFIQLCFADTWTAKDLIKNANTRAECDTIIAIEEAK